MSPVNGHNASVDYGIVAARMTMFSARFNRGLMLYRLIGLSIGLVAVYIVCQSDESFAAEKEKGTLPAWVMNIRLSNVLPTEHFATLSEGVVNRRRWAVFTFANGRSGGKQIPCIESVVLRYQRRSVSLSYSAPNCGALAPPRLSPVITEYVFTNVAGVVVGMTLDPAVTHVRMEFSAGPDVKAQTRLLNSRQATKARVKPFRYVALGFDRRACLEAVEGVAESGSVLFQTAPLECVL